MRAFELLRLHCCTLGKPLYAELSPVTEFREACCRQHEHGECTKGGFCNFMHPKQPSQQVRRDLYAAQRLMLDKRRRKHHRS